MAASQAIENRVERYMGHLTLQKSCRGDHHSLHNNAIIFPDQYKSQTSEQYSDAALGAVITSTFELLREILPRLTRQSFPVTV